ncbi:MAG: hypothetical protein ACK2T7_04195, partial [Anaerolineales bacterium]
MENTNPLSMKRRNPRWLKILVIVGAIWGVIVLIIAAFSDPTPENLALFFSITGSGLYTYILYRTRERWMPRLAGDRLRNAILLGIFNAAFIEILFLIIEKLFGASGVAAHPNLLIDLLITMPWYILMVFSFCRIQERYQYSDAAVLLIGAVYELGADGIVGGQAMPLLSGNVINLWQSWAFLLIFSLWQFIPVYSSMLLPSAWLLDDTPQTNINKATRWM